MGNKQVTAFRESVVETDEVEAKNIINPSYVSSKATSLTAKSSLSGKVEYMDTSNNNEVIFKSNYKTTALGQQDVFFLDGKTDEKIMMLKCKQNVTKDNVIHVYRYKSTYDGQEAAEDGTYLFAEIIISSKWDTSCKSVCSIVEAKDKQNIVYTTNKVAAMKFFAQLRTQTKLVGKMYEGPFASNTTILEVASGTDMLMAAVMGSSVIAGGSSAGALAGACVT